MSEGYAHKKAPKTLSRQGEDTEESSGNELVEVRKKAVKKTSVKFVLPRIVTSIPIQELGLALIGLRLKPPTDIRDAMVLCVAIMIIPGVMQFAKRDIQFESAQGL